MVLCWILVSARLLHSNWAPTCFPQLPETFAGSTFSLHSRYKNTSEAPSTRRSSINSAEPLSSSISSRPYGDTAVKIHDGHARPTTSPSSNASNDETWHQTTCLFDGTDTVSAELLLTRCDTRFASDAQASPTTHTSINFTHQRSRQHGNNSGARMFGTPLPRVTAYKLSEHQLVVPGLSGGSDEIQAACNAALMPKFQSKPSTTKSNSDRTPKSGTGSTLIRDGLKFAFQH